MRKRLVLFAAVLVVIALFSLSGWAQGCAMCKTALEQSEEGRALAGSFNTGILFLMGVPYAMFGAVGVVVFRAYRKRAAEVQDQTHEQR